MVFHSVILLKVLTNWDGGFTLRPAEAAQMHHRGGWHVTAVSGHPLPLQLTLGLSLCKTCLLLLKLPLTCTERGSTLLLTQKQGLPLLLLGTCCLTKDGLVAGVGGRPAVDMYGSDHS